MQAMVNGTFGLIFGLGLLLIGVKYALLWGFLAAMLRYLPYIGPYLAVTFPISLSLAMSEGWGTTLMVIGLFLTLELIISNFIEPRLYGQSMGVSEIALLVSAAFWAFLWGPIGLVLSSPLTVCLVVLGRYTPRLEFLSVLLGDEPALDISISFYQRLLARDQDEAEDLILEQIKESGSPEQVYDAMLLPALGAIKRNRVRGDITEDDERYALQSIQEIVEDLGQRAARRAARRQDRGGVPGGGGNDRLPGDPDLRLPGPRRRGSHGPGDVPAGARTGPMEPRGHRPRDVDLRAARPGGRSGARAGLHRGDASRRPGPHPIPVQAAAVPVPRPEDPRGPMGADGRHRAGPELDPGGRRRLDGRYTQGDRR